MNILILCPGYPDSKKSEYPFVKQLVDEWARQGHQCTVVATYSITKNKRLCPFRSVEIYDNGGSVTILRPNVPSFSNLKFLGFSPTCFFHKIGIKYALKQIKYEQDVVYCHFWQSGPSGYLYSADFNTPMIIATGESNISKMFHARTHPFLNKVNGVVCVSSKNRDESISLGLTSIDKCGVFPNAINANLFKKLDKKECREKLGLPLDAFITIFVGSYKETKGPHRVSEALNGINDGKLVHSIFVGFGDIKPSAKNMLFEGRLQHTDIPLYLNAADVFVLPTQAEGCCNAVIEAMACGLPVISSNLPFNWDVLDDTNSIMVDPNNIDEIRSAIVKLRDDEELRLKLSEGALDRAQNLVIEKRASSIIEFICEKIKK